MVPELPLLALMSPGFLLHTHAMVRKMEANAPAARMLARHQQAIKLIDAEDGHALDQYAEQSLDEHPAHPDKDLLLLMKARAAQLSQEWQAVLEHATRAIGLNPWLRDGYCLRQIAYEALGDEVRAADNAAYAKRIPTT